MGPRPAVKAAEEIAKGGAVVCATCLRPFRAELLHRRADWRFRRVVGEAHPPTPAARETPRPAAAAPWRCSPECQQIAKICRMLQNIH